MMRLFDYRGVRSLVIPLDGNSTFELLNEANGASGLLTPTTSAQTFGEIVIALPDEPGNNEAVAATIVRFGLNTVAGPPPNKATDCFSAVTCEPLPLKLSRQPGLDELNITGQFAVRAFYAALCDLHDHKAVADDVYATPTAAFLCEISGTINQTEHGVVFLRGNLAMQRREPSSGPIVSISLPLQNRVRVLRETTDALEGTNRLLQVQPIAFVSRFSDPLHSAQSLDCQAKMATAIWRRCCVDLHFIPLRTIVDSTRKTCDLSNEIGRCEEYQNYLRVYFVAADLPDGGATTFEPGMLSGHVVITDNNKGNPYLLAHEFGHVLNGNHPNLDNGTQWPGASKSILKPSGSAHKMNRSRNPIENCCQVCNSGLQTGLRCLMTPDP